MHGSKETNWGTNENKGRLVCHDESVVVGEKVQSDINH